MKKLTFFLAVALMLSATAMPLHASVSSESSSSSSSNASNAIVMDLTKPQSTQLWSITMKATVLANTGDALAVALNNPQNMAVEEGDITQKVQVIPSGKTAAVTGVDGAAMDLDDVLPGHNVEITFTYRFQNTTPRTTQAVQLNTVRVRSDAPKRVSTAAVDDYPVGTLVGTYYAQDDSRFQLYVEAGRMASGDTEYFISGLRTFTIGKDVKVTGPDGKSAALSSLVPYQRVAITITDGMWAESYPPQFAGGTLSTVRVLGDGEKLFDPKELASIETFTATFVSSEAVHEGLVYRFTVIPDEGTREAARAARYTVEGLWLNGDDKTTALLDSLKPGARLKISYNGLQAGNVTNAYNIQVIS